jgi:hypothetical protein
MTRFERIRASASARADGRRGRGSERSGGLTSPDADLEGLLAEPPDVVAEVLLQQEGDLVLQHLRRRRSSATADGAATAMGSVFRPSVSGLNSGRASDSAFAWGRRNRRDW